MRCSRCKNDLPETSFGPNKAQGKRGRDYYCRKCVREYLQDHPQQKNLSQEQIDERNMKFLLRQQEKFGDFLYLEQRENAGVIPDNVLRVVERGIFWADSGLSSQASWANHNELKMDMVADVHAKKKQHRLLAQREEMKKKRRELKNAWEQAKKAA